MGYTKFSFIISLVLIIAIPQAKSNAQMWSIGIYVNGINFHLKKPLNPNLYHRSITKNKRVVYNIGGGFRVSYYVNQYAGFTITQAFIPNDCGNKFFGITHAGIFLSTRYFNNSKHEGLLIGGPLLIYRKNWNALPGYNDDHLLSQTKNKIWQYKFVWHGGFLEYQYHYDDNNAAGVHIMPGIPELISVTGQHTSYIK